jgi:hypothetical protein
MDANLMITILTIAGAVLGLVWKYARTKWKWLEAALEKTKLDDLAEGAVTEVYQDYVRNLKASNEDGTLTPEEKKEAMSKAVAKFKDMAKSAGIGVYLKELAEPVIKALLEKAINRMKGSASAAITPPAA